MTETVFVDTTPPATQGVPIPTSLKNPFVVKVLAVWRDSNRNFDHSAKEMEFFGKNKADVYEYIKYFAIKFGLHDVQHLGEGWLEDVIAGKPLTPPDMTDPTVAQMINQEEIHNEESEEQTEASQAGAEALEEIVIS